MTITSDTEYTLGSSAPDKLIPAKDYVYFVTALDRLHNESKPVKVKVKR